MLKEVSAVRCYQLTYTNKKGEALEVAIEAGFTILPVMVGQDDEWTNVTSIKILKPEPEEALDIYEDNDLWEAYANDALTQFDKELRETSKAKKVKKSGKI